MQEIPQDDETQPHLPVPDELGDTHPNSMIANELFAPETIDASITMPDSLSFTQAQSEDLLGGKTLETVDLAFSKVHQAIERKASEHELSAQLNTAVDLVIEYDGLFGMPEARTAAVEAVDRVLKLANNVNPIRRDLARRNLRELAYAQVMKLYIQGYAYEADIFCADLLTKFAPTVDTTRVRARAAQPGAQSGEPVDRVVLMEEQARILEAVVPLFHIAQMANDKLIKNHCTDEIIHMLQDGRNTVGDIREIVTTFGSKPSTMIYLVQRVYEHIAEEKVRPGVGVRYLQWLLNAMKDMNGIDNYSMQDRVNMNNLQLAFEPISRHVIQHEFALNSDLHHMLISCEQSLVENEKLPYFW